MLVLIEPGLIKFHEICLSDLNYANLQEYKTCFVWSSLVTGVSFVVFNGALKTTNDIKAKVSIVEGMSGTLRH